MPLGFHPDRYLAVPGDRAIMLDVATDRYVRLGFHLTAAVARLLQPGAPPTAAIARLLQHGLLVDDAAARPLAQPFAWPTDTGAPRTWQARRMPSLLTSAMATVAARLELGRSGLKSSLAAAARRARHANVDDSAAARACAEAHDRHRAWVPLTPRCLPDGLALHRVLCRHGIAARLVIGVRDRPFAAHCWVEAGGSVLSDPLGAAAELTPILVV